MFLSGKLKQKHFKHVVSPAKCHLFDVRNAMHPHLSRRVLESSNQGFESFKVMLTTLHIHTDIRFGRNGHEQLPLLTNPLPNDLGIIPFINHSLQRSHGTGLAEHQAWAKKGLGMEENKLHVCSHNPQDGS